MGAFTIKAERVVELGLDGLDPLALPCEPAAEPLGPRPRPVPFWRANHPRAIVLSPGRMIGCPRQTLVAHVRSGGGGSHPPPLWLRETAEGKKRVGEELRLRARRAKATARAHA